MNTPDPLLVLICWSFVGALCTAVALGYTVVMLRAVWGLHQRRLDVVRRAAR